MDSRYVSRSLWFGARLCGGFIGATILSIIGSAVVYTAHDVHGNQILADLRYGLSGIGAIIGWIISPLLAIAIAWVCVVVVKGKSTDPGQVGINVVRYIFTMIIILGIVSLIPLYLTLTGAAHPAGLPIFFYDISLSLFCSSGETIVRRRARNGLLFPKAYWPEQDK